MVKGSLRDRQACDTHRLISRALTCLFEIEADDFTDDGRIFPSVLVNGRIDAYSCIHFEARHLLEIDTFAACAPVEIGSAGILKSRGALRNDERTIVGQLGGNIDDVKFELCSPIARSSGAASDASEWRVADCNIVTVQIKGAIVEHIGIDPAGLRQELAAYLAIFGVDFDAC